MTPNGQPRTETSEMMRDFFCLMFASLLLPQFAAAQTLPEPIDFGRQIQPILAKRCYACHGPDKAEGGLRLNSKEAAFAKLESGTHAITAKDAAKSELLKRVTSREEGVQMPPEGAPLTDSQIALLRRWIDEGVEVPRYFVVISSS